MKLLFKNQNKYHNSTVQCDQVLDGKESDVHCKDKKQAILYVIYCFDPDTSGYKKSPIQGASNYIINMASP